MRNQRWVDRFLFSWNDSLFFDSLDRYYAPQQDHFLATLDPGVRAQFVRSGIWWSYRPTRDLPSQGWKIHVSAAHDNVHEVAAITIDYLTTHRIDFKIALDTRIFQTLNSKAIARGSGGKLITIYPVDDDRFRTCLADLAELLDGRQGPYVLSDLRYRDHKALYFRYGQFLNTSAVDVLGRRQPYVWGPGGPTPDDRNPGGHHPAWVCWPFSDWQPPEESDEDVDRPLGDRFLVTAAIRFSNSGGVYEAKDTRDGNRLVVLKEARPHTNPLASRGMDAVDLLNREWAFLERLAGTGSFPEPVAVFDHWEHRFIAEELITGTDLRLIMLQESPLARPQPDDAASSAFLRTFLAVFRNLARAVRAANDRNVVLGDLTPANLIVDPDTYDVTVIDLESCRLNGNADGQEGLLEPVNLFTPGFSHSRGGPIGLKPADDAYALAVNMAYFIFPVAAMLYLRDDVLELYRDFIDDLGWPTRIHSMVLDLAQGRASVSQVLELLEDDEQTQQLIAEVRLPQPRQLVEEHLGLHPVEDSVAAFVEAAADLDRDTLFPVDPFADATNPLSLGFGAGGVLWALRASGRPVRPEWLHWLRDRADRLDPAGYPAGLMSGLAGIAWALDTLGLHDRARRLLALANDRAAQTQDYTFYYGLAGLGMTNLHFYLSSRNQGDLDAARDCARRLRDDARIDRRHAYWLNDFATDGPLTGLGFGQAGVALFLLRLHQLTGDPEYLGLGRRALDWELNHAEPLGDGMITFRHGETIEPYVEVGAAGVAQVLLRYGDLDAARPVLEGLKIGHSVLPGFTFGLSGVADAMLDAAEFIGDPAYRQVALRQLDFVRRIFLFTPSARFGLTAPGDPGPLAVPGEGLLRCACDYLTGSAGVLRVLHRTNSGGTADFLLDEVQR